MLERRRKKVIKRNFQLKFCLILGLPFFFTFFSILVIVLYWLGTFDTSNIQEQVVKAEWIRFLYLLGICFLFLLCIGIIYILQLSHHLAGPMVAIERYILSLKDGNQDQLLKLRSGDELWEMVDEMEKAKKTNPKFFQ